MQCRAPAEEAICGDAGFFDDIRSHGKHSSRESFRDCFEFFARFCEVDRVDFGCTVDEVAFGYAEADSAVLLRLTEECDVNLGTMV